MFSERFDALMNIAEVSNSLLGREVNMNPSYIGRLRSGARPLPKKHAYLADMCRYLAGHIQKDYQREALQRLTGIDSAALASRQGTVQYLEQWLLSREQDPSAAVGRLVSGVLRLSPRASDAPADPEASQKYAAYLYGNPGKRKAVEQFFTLILQEEKPQTLLLFSDENMAWLYEDAAFAARWAELFTKVTQKGNRVKIIHTISRDMGEMLEALIKWMPIYMTGMIEPYYYPRLKDGIFQRTLFIAPNTAAIVSSSVQQATDDMLNLFVTDQAALDALTLEYEHYLALCRPLMRILTMDEAAAAHETAVRLAEAPGDGYFCSAVPPLFTMPKKTVREMAEQSGDQALLGKWERSCAAFRRMIQGQRLTLVLPEPQGALLAPDTLCPLTGDIFSACESSYTREQYRLHIEYLEQMEQKYENLQLRFVSRLPAGMLLYVKENTGVIAAKPGTPGAAFVVSERNMVSAFWDYIEKCVL